VKPTFQDTVFALKKYWSDRGCIITEPYDVEVGAGTMAPETFLRVLGPEPYRVAYVQPSRRPADGRYGENPNRLFRHTQLQVILKPPPADIQEVYLASLEAIGIDLSPAHAGQLTFRGLVDFGRSGSGQAAKDLVEVLVDPVNPLNSAETYTGLSYALVEDSTGIHLRAAG